LIKKRISVKSKDIFYKNDSRIQLQKTLEQILDNKNIKNHIAENLAQTRN